MKGCFYKGAKTFDVIFSGKEDNILGEPNWNAHFTDPNQFDFVSFNIARAAAQQWWRYIVAPNATIGSLIISEGLSVYSALMFWEKKYGRENMRRQAGVF
jgi:hypothetical protein